MNEPSDSEAAAELRRAFGAMAEATTRALCRSALEGRRTADAARWQRILQEIEKLDRADPARVVN